MENNLELIQAKQALAENTMNNTYMLWDKRVASVPVQLMTIDPSYQRVLASSVKRLMRKWDNKECRFLIVSYRDGKFYILDGQHRYEVAKSKGITDLPCEIYTGLTREEEALIFSKQNENVTRLTPYDTFKASITCGDRSIPRIKADLDIKAICEKYDISIEKTGSTRNLKALCEVRALVARHPLGIDRVEWMFELFKNAGWSDMQWTYGGKMIRLFSVMSTKGMEDNTLHKALLKVMRNSTPKELISIANVNFPNQLSAAALRMTLDDLLRTELAVMSESAENIITMRASR